MRYPGRRSFLPCPWLLSGRPYGTRWWLATLGGQNPFGVRGAGNYGVARRAGLREVIHDTFDAVGFEGFLHEFQVQRMNLVVVLRFFIRKRQVQGDWIT